MESWNVMRCPTDEGEYVLKNPSRTLIRFSERTDPDLGALMSEMEELNVPFSYTDKVKEIYFTLMPDHGDHTDGKIRVSYTNESRKILARILIHELAHNVDEQEGLCDRPDIIDEKRKKARYLPDTYARKNVVEYIAIGFETYYCGTPEQKRKMKRCNPKLFGAIRYLHRKYKAR
jgi:hypothetical protein